MKPNRLPGLPSERIYWALILLAIMLRVAHAPLLSYHHPDELWQYQEPAYHLAAGPWVRTWEWRLGVRSWFVPMLLAGPMKIGLWLFPGTFLYILLPRLLMVAVSLLIVVSAIRLGGRISRMHAIIAGFVAATWFEFVYFAPRTLSEPLAVALIFGGAALLLDRRATPFWRLLLAGGLLGASVMIRFQFAPAIAVLTLAPLYRQPRAVLPLALGGLVACGLAGLADLAMGEIPFHWIWANIDQNLVANRSSLYGVSGPFGFFDELASVWSWSAVVLIPLAILGARHYPSLFASALVNFAFHSAIPHKEYRFILLTTMLLVLLAAMGSVDVLNWIGKARTERWLRRAAIFLASGWFALSVVTSFLLPFHSLWGSHGAMLRALAITQRLPQSCGLAIYGKHFTVGSWTYYNRPGPMLSLYGPQGLAAAHAHAGAFDTLIAPFGTTPLPDRRLRFLGCSEKVVPGQRPPNYCVWHRPGGCTEAPPPAFDMNAGMIRDGS